MQKYQNFLTILILTLLLCFNMNSNAKKLLKSRMGQSALAAGFTQTSLSNVFYKSSTEKRQFIQADIKCPSTSGALRGFGLTKNQSTSTSTYDVFNFKFECSSGASDFTDKDASVIPGASTRGTLVDVCKTDGTNGHINIPVGNTCACPSGYVIKNLGFFPIYTSKNYVGVKCDCVKVKSDAKLSCSDKQTIRMSLDSMSGNRGFTLFDYTNSVPVVTNTISALQKVTFSLTSKTDNLNPGYSANAVFFDYTFCYDSASSSGGASGSANIDTVGIKDDDKWIITYYHNLYRNQLATQNTSFKNKLPLAKNMRQMYWNDEIAKKAQEWANNCKFNHSPSTFRTSPKFGYMGENLAIMSSTMGPMKNWSNSVKMWYNEITNFVNSGADVENYTDNQSSGVVGHFTQLAWADTYLIGCGYSVYIENGKTNSLYVCIYAPAGNYLNTPLYKKASSSSDKACPSGTSASNIDFPGLCCIPNNCTKDHYIYNKFP